MSNATRYRSFITVNALKLVFRILSLFFPLFCRRRGEVCCGGKTLSTLSSSPLKISKDTKDEFARLVRFVREESEEDDTFLSTLFSSSSFSLSARGGRPVFEAGAWEAIVFVLCSVLTNKKSNDDASLFFPKITSLKFSLRETWLDDENDDETVLIDVREIPNNWRLLLFQRQILSHRFFISNLHGRAHHRLFLFPTRTVRFHVNGWNILKRMLSAAVKTLLATGETEIVSESGFLRHARDAEFARAVGVF